MLKWYVHGALLCSFLSIDAMESASKKQKVTSADDSTIVLLEAFNACKKKDQSPHEPSDSFKIKVAGMPDHLKKHIASFVLSESVTHPRRQQVKYMLNNMPKLVPALMSDVWPGMSDDLRGWPMAALQKGLILGHDGHDDYVYHLVIHSAASGHRSISLSTLASLRFPFVKPKGERTFMIQQREDSSDWFVTVCRSNRKKLMNLSFEQLRLMSSLYDRYQHGAATLILDQKETECFNALPADIQTYLKRNYNLIF